MCLRRMRRPLFCGCMALVTVIVLWQGLADPPPWESRLSRDLGFSGEGRGQPVTVTGQVYHREVRTLYGEEVLFLYLRSVAVSSDAESGDETSVPNISEQTINDRLVCQLTVGGEAANQAADRALVPYARARGESVLRFQEGQVSLGSRVAVQGRLELYPHATNPGEWDSADYNLITGVAGQLKQARLLGSDNGCWWVREGLLRLRGFLKDRLYRGLPSREASVLAKMLLGEKDGLDRELKELYQDNGIAHVLAISGLHITLLGMGLYRMLRRWGCPIMPAALAGGCVILLYGGMVGWGISAVRAIGMYLIRMLGEIWGRHYDMLTAMGVLAAGMICHNPRLAYHCGFLLSFGAVAGMGMVYPALLELPIYTGLDMAVRRKRLAGERLAGERLARERLAGKRAAGERPAGERPAGKRAAGKRLAGEAECGFGRMKWGIGSLVLLRNLLQGLLASLSITLATLPIQLYFFYQIPVYGILLNLAVLPLMGLLLAGGLMLMAIPAIVPVRWVVVGILDLFEGICRLAQCLPGHLWITGRPELWQIAGYYGILALAVFLLTRKEESWKGLHCGKGRMGLVLLTVAVILFARRWDRGFTFTMLDVGQGDCVCVRTARGQVYLFDGGSSNRSRPGEYVLIPYLKYRGFGTVDGIFVSHGDQDHINAVKELLTDSKGLRLKVLYLPRVAEPLPDSLAQLRELAREAGCQVRYLSQGMGWQQGDFRLTCLWPAEGYRGESNASSACYLLEQGEFHMLLTGDVEGQGERELATYLAEMSVPGLDVLKVAHHGSRYSTSGTFLQAAAPRLALISAGRDNSYGHPHGETLTRLTEAGSRIVQTTESGAVTVRLLQNQIYIKQFNFKYLKQY